MDLKATYAINRHAAESQKNKIHMGLVSAPIVTIIEAEVRAEMDEKKRLMD